MSTIDVHDYDPSNFVPRGVVNLVEGRRLPSAADVPRRVCLLGVSSFPEEGAAAPANRPVRVYSERPAEDATSGSSAEELFGAGSELFLMCRAAFQAYPGVELWGVALVEPEGGASATASLTIAGDALRVGEWTIVVHGTPVLVRVEAESDPEETLVAIAEALNARDDLPIQQFDFEALPISDGPVPDSKTLTLTARHLGVNGNYIDVFRRGGAAGQSLTVTRFTGGQGENDLGNSGADPEGALGELLRHRFHYLVVANTDAVVSGNLVELKEHLERIADPIEGKRQQALFGWIGTLESAIGDETSGTRLLNSPRMQCTWSKGSSMTPGDLASALAAQRAWMEGSFAAANTAGQIVTGVPRPRLPADLPTEQEQDTALHGGVTPLQVKGTDMSLVRSVTTRFVNSAGAESYELLDTIKVTVSDYVADDIAFKMDARFRGFKLAPDADVPVPARTATPSTIRKSLLEWLREYEKAGLLRQVDEYLDEVRVEIVEGVDGRINFELPEAVVDICAVAAGNLIRF